MRKSQEIKNKLVEAEDVVKGKSGAEQSRLAVVIITLRWVLGVKIVQEPTDPVSTG